jgi:hypothetical protein
MARKPSPAPTVDWADMVALYHQGDCTLAQLRQYAEQTRVSAAAANELETEQALGAALKRKARKESLRKRAAGTPTVLIGVSRGLHRFLDELACSGPKMAAQGSSPGEELTQLCDISGLKIHVPGSSPSSREVGLTRWLTHYTEGGNVEWKLVITLSPRSEIKRLICGAEPMMATDVFSLHLPEQTSTAVVDVCMRDLTIDFRDGSQTRLVFV